MNKVKICGITNLDDALACAKIEVDFIGFIFYKKSPRFIDVNEAKTICEYLSNYKIKKVGVFVDEIPSKVNQIADYVGLDFVQLHGAETPELVNKINIKKIKAFSVKSKGGIKYLDYKVDYWLFDTFDKNLHGGTGRTFDWSLLSDITNRDKIIISGGLSEDNIIDAVKKTEANFFDICSGVEKSPGKKDIKKLQTIVRLIKL